VRLRSRRFERDVRRLVRRELRASPDLWAEYKRRRPRWTEGDAWFIPILLLLEPPVLLYRMVAFECGAQSVLVILTLQALAMAFLRAHQLLCGLYAPRDLAPFAPLPISDESLFRHQWGSTVRSSLWALYVFPAVYLALAAPQSGRPAALAGAAALAGFQWALILSLGALIARYFRLGHVSVISAVLLVAFFACLVGWNGPNAWLSRELGLALAATPAGWVTHAFHHGLLRGNPLAFLAVVPALLVVLPAAWIVRAMRKGYDTARIDFFRDIETAEAEAGQSIEEQVAARAGVPLESVEDAALAAELEDAIENALAASAQRGILEGRFLAPMQWRRGGLLEQIVGWSLGRRERIAAEFMVGAAPNWTRRWRFAAIIAAIAALVLSFWRVAPQGPVIWAGVLATLFAVPVLGGSWAALGRVPCGEHFSPLYALFPVTYREMASVICVANAIRCVAWLPVAAAYSALFAAPLGLTPLGGATWAAKGAAVAIAAQPLLVAWRVAYSGSGHENLDLTRLGLLVPLVLGSAGFAAGAAAFAVAGSWLAGAGGAGMVALSLGTCLLFGHFHNRGTLDLIHTSTR